MSYRIGVVAKIIVVNNRSAVIILIHISCAGRFHRLALRHSGNMYVKVLYKLGTVTACSGLNFSSGD